MRKKFSVLVLFLLIFISGANVDAQEHGYESYGQAGFTGKYEFPKPEEKLPPKEKEQLINKTTVIRIPNAGDTSSTWMYVVSVGILSSSLTLLHWQQKKKNRLQQAKL
ncbi:MAG: LPXTG cell wall anchor domain-containing protein [Streptococcaceae bacterium]|nr:LPXTG cell wall anchor domain-containing protein [Streptococcaceae bacterium]